MRGSGIGRAEGGGCVQQGSMMWGGSCRIRGGRMGGWKSRQVGNSNTGRIGRAAEQHAEGMTHAAGAAIKQAAPQVSVC